MHRIELWFLVSLVAFSARPSYLGGARSIQGMSLFGWMVVLMLLSPAAAPISAWNTDAEHSREARMTLEQGWSSPTWPAASSSSLCSKGPGSRDEYWVAGRSVGSGQRHGDHGHSGQQGSIIGSPAQRTSRVSAARLVCRTVVGFLWSSWLPDPCNFGKYASPTSWRFGTSPLVDSSCPPRSW
jgi:hypothetical protein